MICPEVRELITNLMTDYVHYIDYNRLEEWLELFTEDSKYKILSRENVDQDLPLELLSCHNKNMLRDRILSLREANIYNIHYDKHLLGPLRIYSEADNNYQVHANYAVYQTNDEGESDLFGVGTYRDIIYVIDGEAKFKEKIAVMDTFGIDRLLSTPI